MIAGLLLAAAGCAPGGNAGGCTVGVEEGDCAPDFSLPDRNGEPVTLSSFRGKVALVDISAVW